MRVYRTLALILFCMYLAVFPGSTLTVALDRVPAWGEWLGGALLIAQGLAVLCGLLGHHGRHGAAAALLVFLLAWAVEYAGVTTGFPFGRYDYTDMLQPQFFGVVPLAIACAWLMVAIGSWQLAQAAFQRFGRSGRGDWRPALLAATLVLLLDLQIETVATRINQYWIWREHGPYYGVPTANFVAWWLVGLVMALLLARLLGAQADRVSSGLQDQHQAERPSRAALGATRYVSRIIPAALYLLSTFMFAAVNLARGYALAGLVGAAVLLAALGWLAVGRRSF